MSTELVHHPDRCKLGKLDAKAPHKMLRELLDFEKALRVITVPVNVINSSSAPAGPAMAVSLAMYLNDSEGDCTCAGAANTLRVNSNGQIELSDGDVQSAYEAVTRSEGAAFDPATGANDNGCAELDVLDHWVKAGIGSDKLLGHAGVDMTNAQEVKLACYLTGSLYTGAALAVAQQSQQIWDYTKGSPPWGGHCPPTVDIYDSTPAGLVVGGTSVPAGSQIDVAMTWGAYKASTRSFRLNQADEGHALITDAWVAKALELGLINHQALDAYLKTLQPES